jgi:hypothetical protein
MKSGVLSLYQGVHGSGCRVQNASMCREMCTVKLYKGIKQIYTIRLL